MRQEWAGRHVNESGQPRDGYMYMKINGFYFLGRPKRWSVVGEGDVGPVCEDILRHFKDNAITYYEKYSDIESAYKILSDNTPIGRLHSPINIARTKRAVAFAYLYKGEDEFKACVARSEKFLDEVKDMGISEFRRYAEILSLRL